VSDQLRDLVMPVGEFEPPFDLHTRIVARERELAAGGRQPWSSPRLLVIAVASAGLALRIIMLALAAHSRSSAPRPAKSSAAPPRCTKADYRNEGVVANGFLVECGPASAVVRSDGVTHVIRTGNCGAGPGLDSDWNYFGVRSRRAAPHIGFAVHVIYRPGDARERRPGRPYPIAGAIEMVPGARESLSGTARFAKGFLPDATFVLHGRTTGRTYTGSWKCGNGG
jgi:hypothetical protein